MSRVLIALLACLLLGLIGCASPTPYVKAVDEYGYSDQAIESDRYRVTFSGNSRTSRDMVENSMLYRAAEITVETGHDYFLIVEERTESQRFYQTIYNCHRYRVYRRSKGRDGYFETGPCDATSMPYDSYIASAVILVRRGKTPDEANAYDARDVLEHLRPSIERPKAT